MNYLRFYWYIGYHVTDVSKDKTYKLAWGKIYLFDEQGNITKLDLDYGCSFLIELGEHQLKRKKKPDFTANEPFYVLAGKKTKWDEYSKIDIYIPQSLLNTTFGDEFEEENFDSSSVFTYRTVSIEAMHFGTYGGQSHEDIVVEDLGDGWHQRLSFKCYVKSENKDWYKRNQKLSKQIKDTCGISLDPYQLRDLLTHYKLTKIRKPKTDTLERL